MPRKAVNPTDSPVVIDETAAQIDGKSSGPVDPAHPFVVAAIAAGTLLFAADATEPGEPAGQPDPEVLERAGELAGETTRSQRRGGAAGRTQ